MPGPVEDADTLSEVPPSEPVSGVVPVGAVPEPSRPVPVRDRILVAAARQFAKRGYHATSLQQVAEDVGIRKPSVLYHFASKADLRRAVVVAVVDRWVAALPEPEAAGTPIVDRQRQLIAGMLGFLREDPARARLLLRELVDQPEMLEAVLKERLGPVLARFGAVFREAQGGSTAAPEIHPEGHLFHVFTTLITAVATAPLFGRLVQHEGDAIVAEALRTCRLALVPG